MQGQGPSNINLCLLVYFFDVYRHLYSIVKLQEFVLQRHII